MSLSMHKMAKRGEPQGTGRVGWMRLPGPTLMASVTIVTMGWKIVWMWLSHCTPLWFCCFPLNSFIQKLSSLAAPFLPTPPPWPHTMTDFQGGFYTGDWTSHWFFIFNSWTYNSFIMTQSKPHACDSLVFQFLLWKIDLKSCSVYTSDLNVAVHNDGGSWHSLFQITLLHLQSGLDVWSFRCVIKEQRMAMRYSKESSGLWPGDLEFGTGWRLRCVMVTWGWQGGKV